MMKRRLDLVSLVAGASFVLVGVAALTNRLDVRDFSDDWYLPVALVVLAVAILASVLPRDRADGAVGVDDQASPEQ